MESRVEMFLEDFDGLIESHTEFVDSLDADDAEVGAALAEIEVLLKPLASKARQLRNRGTADDDEMDTLETMMEELNDLFVELAAVA